MASGIASTSSSVLACLRSKDVASKMASRTLANAAASSFRIFEPYWSNVFDTQETAMRAVFSAAPPSLARVLRTVSVSSWSIVSKTASNVVSHKSPPASSDSAPSNTRCNVKIASSRTMARVSSKLMRPSSRTKSPQAPAMISVFASSVTDALVAHAHIAMFASESNCNAATLRSSPPCSLSTNALAASRHDLTFAAFTFAASRMIRVSPANPVSAASGCLALAMRSLHTVSQLCRVLILSAPLLIRESISATMRPKNASATAGLSVNKTGSASNKSSATSSSVGISLAHIRIKSKMTISHAGDGLSDAWRTALR
mmetsp:Transcript_677/g.2806  ORF Transcript_677/g.2806 Transcript_677/m.2806 type:complete len:315 (+) Transcript_677:464-1408(+)